MFKKIALVGILALGSGVAAADPIQANFNFATTGFFASATCVNDTTPSPNCGLDGLGSQLLSWGDEYNSWDMQSALRIVNSGGTYGRDYNHDGDYTDVGEGLGGLIGNSIVTNGGWETISAFEHYNNIILGAGGNLGASNIPVSLTLTGVSLPSPWGSGLLPLSFNETPNQSNCGGANPNGTYCDDYFTGGFLEEPYQFSLGGNTYQLSFRFVAGPGATLVSNGFTDVPFDHDGNPATPPILVRVENFTVFTSEPCTNPDCSFGPDGYRPGYSVLYTQARIDVVPEPGSLALIGLGLLGLGLRRRMKV